MYLTLYIMQLSALLAAGMLLMAGTGAFAQTTSAAKASVPKSTLLKDGAYRRNGLTMRLQAGQASRLSAPLTLENGAVVRSNGIIISRDGTRQLLPENHAINMQGGIVLLRDDMLTPRAIAQQEQAVTGATGETQFLLSSEPGTGSVSPRLTAKLLRTEQRLALLEEITTQLERRTKVKSATTLPLDQQLSQIDKQLQQSLPATSTPSDAPATDATGIH